MADDFQMSLARLDDAPVVIDTAAAELREALRQKSALLHEVDHRVKNNLQLITSLLQLQVRRAPEPAVRAALRATLERVNAVSTVHRRLFQSDDVERFDVAAFILDLVTDAVGQSGRTDIGAELDLERVEVSAAKAAPIALLFSELLGNSLRHAFPDGRAGTIRVRLQRQGEHFRIEITDNGVGLVTTGDRAAFGLTIVRLLCEQLRANCETTDAAPGVRTVIRLPMDGQY